MHLLVFIVAIFLLSACASRPVVEQAHINVNPEGHLVDDREEPVPTRDRVAHINQQLDKIGDYIARGSAAGQRPVHLMLFVHGGLVSTRSALNNINSLTNPTRTLNQTEIYPFFVNWNSTLESALIDDLFLIRKGQRRPITGIVTSPFIILSRAIDSVVRGVPNLFYQYDTEKTFLEEWKKEEVRDNFSYKLTQTGKTVATIPVTLVTVPLFSGFGEGSWKMMKRRIDQMFAVEVNSLPSEGREVDKANGGMRLFIKMFQQRFDGQIQNDEIKIDLVGHSMGAIVITRLLREFPDMEFSRIIYLAPATSIEDFQTTIPRYLQTHRDTRFYSYSLAVLDETQELNYYAPKGSLLVWIDNLFEPGLSAEDRRVGSFLNRRAFGVDRDVTAPDVCRRMRFVKFTGERGANKNKQYPFKHGSFDNDGLLQRQLRLATFKLDVNDPDYISKEKDFYQRECTACAVYLPCSDWLHKMP